MKVEPKKSRTGLIVVISSLLVIGGVVGYIFWKKAKDKKDEQAKKDAEAKRIADEQAKGGGGSTGGGGNTSGGSTGGGGNTGGSTTTLSNFELLQKNLNAKADKNGLVFVKFNGNKNSATFFNNNRFSINVVGQGGYLKKGSYSNGGLTLTVDGATPISSSSVWGNLLTALK